METYYCCSSGLKGGLFPLKGDFSVGEGQPKYRVGVGSWEDLRDFVIRKREENGR